MTPYGRFTEKLSTLTEYEIVERIGVETTGIELSLFCTLPAAESPRKHKARTERVSSLRTSLYYL